MRSNNHIDIFQRTLTDEFVQLHHNLLKYFEEHILDLKNDRNAQTQIAVGVKSVFNRLLESLTSISQLAWDIGVSKAIEEKSLVNIPNDYRALPTYNIAPISKHLDRISGLLIVELHNSIRSTDNFLTTLKEKLADSIDRGVLKFENIESQGHADQQFQITKYIIDVVDKDKIKEQVKRHISSKEKPITIRVWRASEYEESDSHTLMNGKGVPDGIKFRLVAKDGNSYDCNGPIDSALPKTEKEGCRCAIIPKVIFVTQEEIDEIIDIARDSGGYVDSRWA
jgi:hypothetical protein